MRHPLELLATRMPLVQIEASLAPAFEQYNGEVSDEIPKLTDIADDWHPQSRLMKTRCALLNAHASVDSAAPLRQEVEVRKFFELVGTSLASAFLSHAAMAQVPNAASAPSRAELRRVVEPGGFLTTSLPSAANRSGCQPERGDVVAVGRGVKPMGEPLGATLIDVRVLSGPCKNATGWIGLHRLTAENSGK